MSCIRQEECQQVAYQRIVLHHQYHARAVACGAGGGSGAVVPAAVSPVPESSSLAMIGLGALFLAGVATRRRNQA